jgi:hypothetical protein
MVDHGDPTSVSLDKIVDLTEARRAAGIDHHYMLDTCGPCSSQLELRVTEVRISEETPHCRLLRTRKKHLGARIQSNRAHGCGERIEIGREVGCNDLHAPIVLKSERLYGSTAIRPIGFPAMWCCRDGATRVDFAG